MGTFNLVGGDGGCSGAVPRNATHFDPARCTLTVTNELDWCVDAGVGDRRIEPRSMVLTFFGDAGVGRGIGLSAGVQTPFEGCVEAVRR